MEFAKLAEMATQLGFAKIGACSTSAFEAQKELVDSQPTLKERAQLRFAPQEDDPQSSALVVMLWPYAPVPLPAQENEVFVDSYYAASNAAYHAAKRLEEDLENKGYLARANVSYPAKAAAVRAGLGVIGHNGLLITPEYGTRVVIILMLTDAVEADVLRDSAEVGSCLQCRRCAAACSSGAIDAKGMSHPERCLRNFMMEGVVVPEESREAMGMRLIGCDQCQRVCPMQKTAEQPRETAYVLDALMTAEPAQFSYKKHFKRIIVQGGEKGNEDEYIGNVRRRIFTSVDRDAAIVDGQSYL